MSDEEMDTIEIEEEDWIEYIKRSIVDAMDKMERAKIRCWNRTHKKWNGNWHWELQLHRVKDGWKRLLNGTLIWVQDIKTNRAIGRPRKRWEDDINDFLKQVLEEKENEDPIERRNQTNNNWIDIAKDWRRWALLEGKYTMTV